MKLSLFLLIVFSPFTLIAQESAKGMYNRIQRAAASPQYTEDEIARNNAIAVKIGKNISKPDAEKIEKVEKASPDFKKKLIEEYTKQIKTSRSPESQKLYADKIRQLRTSKSIMFPSLEEFEINQIGLLCDKAYDGGRPYLFKVLSVPDNEEIIAQCYGSVNGGHNSIKDVICHFKGFSTAGVTKEKYIIIDSPIEIMKSEKYRTLDGTPAMALVVEPFIVPEAETKKTKGIP